MIDRRLLPVFLLTVPLLACATHPAPGGTPAISPALPTTRTTMPRQAFAAAFARVHEGMPADAFKAILGPPDDVRTQNDPGGITLVGVREIWSYGTDHHLGFATLGTVAISDHGTVQYLRGTKGADDLVNALGETELRRLLCVIAEVAEVHADAADFNPRTAIVAVNALQPLGKQRGVAVLREYMQISFAGAGSDDQGLFVIMRALFEVPPLAPGEQPVPYDSPRFPGVLRRGYLLPPVIAVAGDPDHPTKFPRLPLAIIDDVPFFVAAGITIAGVPESPEAHLDALSRDGQWRTKPLHPSNNPIGAMMKLLPLLPKDSVPPTFNPFIVRQVLRLIDTVYPEPPSMEEGHNFWGPAWALLQDAQQEVAAAPIHWDAARGCYVHADGTTLPPSAHQDYPLTFLNPTALHAPHYHVWIFVQRRSDTQAEIIFELDAGQPTPTFHLSVQRAQDPQSALLTEVVGNTTDPGSYLKCVQVRVAPGEQIRITVDSEAVHDISDPIAP